MDPLVLFITTFLAVFFGELGDKSQMVSALGALRNYHHRFVVFLASTSALVLLTGLAVWFTTLVPSQWVAILSCLGGFGLVAFGLFIIYLTVGASNEALRPRQSSQVNRWGLFLIYFNLIFWNELGDKTQLATLGFALASPESQLVVFVAASLALVIVSGLTIYGVRFVPFSLVRPAQLFSAMLLIVFGLYTLSHCG